jgi:hypothetical protein
MPRGDRQVCDSRQTLNAAATRFWPDLGSADPASRSPRSHATRSAADANPLLSRGRQRPAAAPLEEFLALYGMLVEADDQADAPELGRLGWILFAKASMAQEAYHDMADLLDELRAASRAAVAGDGNPASLALLRHVLARHGWLPPPDATPLQVLSAQSCRPPPPAVQGGTERTLTSSEAMTPPGTDRGDEPAGVPPGRETEFGGNEVTSISPRTAVARSGPYSPEPSFSNDLVASWLTGLGRGIACD